MREKIKVSIIMPSLNVAAYIEESVRSACGQSLEGVEILCVDGGSTDGTWECLERLAGADGRIGLLKAGMRSYGYQVNMALREARGEYIGILETDDFVSPDMYAVLYGKAKGHGLDFVKSDYIAYWTQKGGERYLIRRRSMQEESLYGRVIRPREHMDLATDDWYLWNGIYRRDFLNDNGIRFSETPGAAFQDIGFLYQTLVLAERAMYIRGEYYYYCMDREGASSNAGKDLQYACQEYGRIYHGLC